MLARKARLDGRPLLSENEASIFESDVSSIISISDRLGPSETDEDEEKLRETQKYRMPDIGKTRLHLRTKQPLAGRQPVQPSHPPTGESMPPTPRSRPLLSMASPVRPGSHQRNLSLENISDSDFMSSGLSRAGSIYTLGRVSFSGQLARLTNMRLPDANSLEARIDSIPTAKDAAKALNDAADQICSWISKAADVLQGLQADDDVEWAAAAGREGIEDTDGAITRFEKLIEVYVTSIGRLQMRDDVQDLSRDDLVEHVKRMDAIVTSWKNVRLTLNGVKGQVQLAMDWEELWNKVLGEIGQELGLLNRMIFEMEEKRHQGAESLLSSKDSIDLNELETIVEEHPGRSRQSLGGTLSTASISDMSTLRLPPSTEYKDDATLLALFARMQPIRASLDFLPMRLSAFNIKGRQIFPSACLDLEQRRDQLEGMWMRLENDAESLRRELGEDRWILVFRNAGRQAFKMCESVARSYSKLEEAIDMGEHESDMTSLVKKIENCEAKKTHYGPAIERVLAIIDRGVSDRLTVNGEVLRLQSDMKRRWMQLKDHMQKVDAIFTDLSALRERQLRDSISTVVSSERSLANSLIDTPASSPASSVVEALSRKSSFRRSRTPTQPTLQAIRLGNPQASNLRTPSTFIPRKVSLHQDHAETAARTPSLSPAAPRSSPMAGIRPKAVETPPNRRPRWSMALKGEDKGFLPFSALEPSPYVKTPITPKSYFLRSSQITTNLEPSSAPAGRRAISNPNPVPSSLPRLSASHQTLRTAALFGSSTSTTAEALPRSPSSLNPKTSVSTLRPTSRTSNARRKSWVPSVVVDGNEADNESPTQSRRPPSALATSRARGGVGTGPKVIDKPKWRPG